MLAQLLETYPDDVTVVYRHFPLNQIHPNAQKAAEASEAAGEQGAFWEYHDYLYDNQPLWANLPPAQAREFFIEAADELELDDEQFEADLNSGRYETAVEADLLEALELGLAGTPSVIFNGQLLSGQNMPPLAYWVWDAFVQLEFLTDHQYDEPPEMVIDLDKSYTAVVELENGDIFEIELFPESAPITVNNFIFLAQEGWFDGVSFHRVLPGFVAQTGDPTGSGLGGPGYFIPNETDPSLSHDQAGMVAMANSGPDRNGSQWYITLGDVSQLDGSYTIFGQISDGLDVVRDISPRDPSANPEAPAGDRIISITIEESN